ncbi:MAG: glycosyltransferase [Candidatus Gottesmanbacteria bacterium]
MQSTDLPSISIILPTYNAEKYLYRCLSSITMQDYPKEKIEILVIDGGSHDKTLEIAKQFDTKILKNPYRDCDEGKSIGLHHASGEIIALIDADNELSSPLWLKTMVQPLVKDITIFGVESPWLLRKDDPLINQYETLLQVADPLARCFHPKMEIIDRGSYIIYRSKLGDTPVVGANGFLWRRKVIDAVGGYEKKFEEVNFIARVIEGGYFSYARVKKVGIYHYYCTSVSSYIKKRIKIGRKFLGRKERGQKTWVDHANQDSFLIAVAYNISIIGPLFEAIKEYRKSHEVAWLLHPLISWLTIIIYAYAVIEYYTKILIKKVA